MGNFKYFWWLMGKGVSRHNEVLHYLEKYYAKHHRMPTIKQAMHDLKIVSGPLYRILASLVRQGKLKKIHPKFEILYKLVEK